MLGRRTTVLLAMAVVAPALTGCLGEIGSSPAGPGEDLTGGSTDPTATGDLWDGGDRLMVVEHEHDMTGGFESDVLCTAGGGPRIDRTKQPVAPGTDHLEVTVAVEPAWPGIQIGYVVDGTNADYLGGEEKEVTWLPAVYPTMEQTFEVDVSPDQVEQGEIRWSFYYQVNPGAEELCYTGAGTGVWSVSVAAVRG